MQNELNELRHQIRTLKRMLYTLCGVGVLVGCVASTNLNTVPDVIQAKSFEVVNDEGKVVVSIAEHVLGGGDLNIYNSTGAVSVAGLHAIGDSGGILNIANKDALTRVFICVNEDGDGFVQTFGNKGEITSKTP